MLLGLLLPPLLPLGYSTFLYGMLVAVLYSGISQYLRKRKATQLGEEFRTRNLTPLGAIAVIVGIISLIQSYHDAFEAIEIAGDISPDIVASAMRKGFADPTLGLVCLGISYVFRYLNQ